MDVTFRRTGARRYAVRAEREGFPTVEMDPAPGYDPALPHDLIHFAVEQELGLELGVFGQLARGGTAGSFHLDTATPASRERSREQRRVRRRGERLAREGRSDGELSERAASICHHAWLAASSDPKRRNEARAMEPYVERIRASASDAELDLLSGEAIERVCRRLDRLSARWTELEVGEAIVLPWEEGARRHESSAAGGRG